MEDETRPMKVHKVTVLIVDHDDLGPDGVKKEMELVRYPNRCIIALSVMDIETKEIEYNDAHPLNSYDKQEAAYRELFGEEKT